MQFERDCCEGVQTIQTQSRIVYVAIGIDDIVCVSCDQVEDAMGLWVQHTDQHGGWSFRDDSLVLSSVAHVQVVSEELYCIQQLDPVVAI